MGVGLNKHSGSREQLRVALACEGGDMFSHRRERRERERAVFFGSS